jgi:glycerophosphoryl diester phosphodiesterase
MSDWHWPDMLAHRCGGALAPENSLAGLGIAARLGCRAVEFDVMLSCDGIPVLIHDETLDRTAGRPGQVSRLAAADLLATDVGLYFHPAFAGQMIPSLELALQCCLQLGLSANVEIKPADGQERETGRVVGGLLRTLKPSRRPAILLSSFSADALAAAAAEVPDIPRGFLSERFSPEALLTVGRLGCVALNLGRQNLQAEHVAEATNAGLKVLVYTVNSRQDASRLHAWGVTGVFSDRPDLLLPGLMT